ncbi:solute carrier family 22 member 6-like [Paramacrobiotus metropolitanus]|uniref:solute carrier family 22 member 6-like n=1 Tax=Paramacrobiotus metropolitanus TaxID=2943436 RepID=UPI002445AF53|nr:solute carrier family 22 member 6-like [Paramacrobiotus metropolitanus]
MSKLDVYEYNGRNSGMEPEVGEAERKSNVDVFMDVLGNPGRFQMLQFVLLSMLFIACAMNDLAPIFYDLDPHKVDCSASNGGTVQPDLLWANASETKWWHHPEVCKQYCPNSQVFWYYYRDNVTRSVVADLNLICDNRAFISLASTIYFVGCAVGGPTFGFLADKFGRRRALFLANILYTTFSVGLIFIQDIVAFIILRFAIGFARQGLQATFLVLMLEWTHPEQRSRIGAATQFFYVAGVLLLAFFAFLFPWWRHLQIVLACANFVFLTYYWMAPESLQWLLMNGRYTQAEKNSQFVAKFNGINLHTDDLSLLQRLADEEEQLRASSTSRKTHSVLDCFRSKKLAILTLLSCYIWFVANFGYIGISFMIGDISETMSAYANLALAGSLEAIPTALTIPLVSKFGRRFPMAGYFTVATIFLCVAGSLTGNPAQLPLALVGRMSIVGSFSIIYVWATELFPTVIRNQGFGLLSLAFMTGGMVAPEVLLLGERLGYAAGDLAIPITVIGCCTFLAVIAALILPETKYRKNYPETFEDVQALPYGFSNKCTGR